MRSQRVRCAKAAILTSPDNPPEAVGKALVECGANPDLVAVCSRLGCSDESVTEMDLQSLAGGTFDPLSVVVFLGPGGLPGVGFRHAGDPSIPRSDGDRVLAWGLPEEAFTHRGEMVTKAEVRAVALGKLELPSARVLWDVGAGSASVAIESALLQRGLTVFAVESDPDDASRAAANASAHGVAVHVIEGHAPDVFAGLPDPDRVFWAAEGSTCSRLRWRGSVPGEGRLRRRVDRTGAAAAESLGSLVQVSAARGSRLPDGGWRLTEPTRSPPVGSRAMTRSRHEPDETERDETEPCEIGEDKRVLAVSVTRSGSKLCSCLPSEHVHGDAAKTVQSNCGISPPSSGHRHGRAVLLATTACRQGIDSGLIASATFRVQIDWTMYGYGSTAYASGIDSSLS